MFLYSQTRTEHAGIFVVRARSCLQAGSQNQNRGSASDAGASPFSTPRSQMRSGPVGGRGGKFTEHHCCAPSTICLIHLLILSANRDDGLIGKTVRIQAGKWKGYLGTVCDATATHVQVELHSRLKKVMVVRERVAVAGDKFGATEDAGRTIMDAPGMMAPDDAICCGRCNTHVWWRHSSPWRCYTDARVCRVRLHILVHEYFDFQYILTFVLFAHQW